MNADCESNVPGYLFLSSLDFSTVVAGKTRAVDPLLNTRLQFALHNIIFCGC